MKNLGQLMKQAQEMQTKMAEMQQRLVDVEITGSAAAGMVNVVMNGKGEMRKVKIDPTLIIPDEAEVLEDLIVAAQNDARLARVAQCNDELMAIQQNGGKLPESVQPATGNANMPATCVGAPTYQLNGFGDPSLPRIY